MGADLKDYLTGEERPTIKSQAKKYFNFLLKKGIANKLVQIQA